MAENEKKTAANTSRPPEMTGYGSFTKAQLISTLQERDSQIVKLRHDVFISDANYCEITGRSFLASELRLKASKLMP
jgi:hypothetical protein